MSLLTLNQSTLFYWTLSDYYTGNKRKREDEIKDWSSAVRKSKPPSSFRAGVARHARAGSAAPSLMSNAGRSESSAPSVLTGNVKIISRP